MIHSLSSSFILILLSCILFTCTKDKGRIYDGYPEEISNILVKKCATAGCHTRQSKDAAAGLSTETWDDLFQGDRNGAVCIPYRHEYSTIFLFTNTDPAKGPVNYPTMPLNKPALTKEEMKILTDWIDAGAPNSEGKIAFADNPNRKKIYVTNQGCNVVTVFDAATQLQMRYIDVGSALDKYPHMIKISPDGNYWYVCFYSGNVFQKFRTSDDSYAGQATIGNGSWNTFAISNDSKYAYVVDWRDLPDGKIAPVNLTNMTTLPAWSGIFNKPHGSSINPKGDTVYVTCSTGNFIYKILVADASSPEEFSVDPSNSTPLVSAPVEPHDIIWKPDSSIYFVTCSKSNYVSVMSRNNDIPLTTLQTGHYPVEMALSNDITKPYLFVTCMYDTSGPETNRGSVTVFNYESFDFIKNIKTGMAEPHGIGIDEANGLVYVANRNEIGSVIPHHASGCGGANGFISFIDVNTLTVIPNKQIEIARDPYSVAVRP